MSIRCNICGKEYSYGRKISLDCCGKVSNFGIIFENEREYHNWHCISIERPKSQRNKGQKCNISVPLRTTEKNFALVCE